MTMEKGNRQTDAALVAHARRGDREAFGVLVQRYQNLVCAMAYSRLGDVESAQDVAQEAFLVSLENLQRLRSGSRFGPWLRGITRRLCNRWRRSEAYRRALEEELRRRTPAMEIATPVDALEAKENGQILKRAMDRLPLSLREVLILHYFRGQSPAETARDLSISQAAVYKRVERAKRHMREYLTSEIERKLRNAEPGEHFAERTLAAIPIGSICAKLGLDVARVGVAEALRQAAQAAVQHAPTILTGGGVAMAVKKGTIAAAVFGLLAVAGTGYLVVRYGRVETERPASRVDTAESAQGGSVEGVGGEVAGKSPSGRSSKSGEGAETHAQSTRYGRWSGEKLDGAWLKQEMDRWSPGWADSVAAAFLEDQTNAFNRYLMAAILMVGPETDPRFEEAAVLLRQLVYQKKLELLEDPETLALLKVYLAANAEALAELKAAIREAQYYQAPPDVPLSLPYPPYILKFRGEGLELLLAGEALVLYAEGNKQAALSGLIGTLNMGLHMMNGSSGNSVENYAGLDVLVKAGPHMEMLLLEADVPELCRDAIEQLHELPSVEVSYSRILSANTDRLATWLSSANADVLRQVCHPATPPSSEELEQELNQIHAIFSPLIEAADLPYPQFASVPEPQFPDGLVLAKVTAPKWKEFKNAVVWFLGARATLAAYEAAAGVKLYQLDTGTSPESLGQLVPGYLAELPTDPFSGRPLRYARAEDGAIVYSVGPDMKDDLGKRQAEPGHASAEGDYVFAIR